MKSRVASGTFESTSPTQSSQAQLIEGNYLDTWHYPLWLKAVWCQQGDFQYQEQFCNICRTQNCWHICLFIDNFFSHILNNIQMWVWMFISQTLQCRVSLEIKTCDDKGVVAKCRSVFWHLHTLFCVGLSLLSVKWWYATLKECVLCVLHVSAWAHFQSFVRNEFSHYFQEYDTIIWI